MSIDAASGVLDLNRFGTRLWDEPYAVLDELRRSGPAHLVRLPDGNETWLIVGHAEVRRALCEPTLSKNWFRATGVPGPEVIGRNMLTADPPDHTRLRRLVSGAFSARRIERMRPLIEATVDGLLDRLEPYGRADLIVSLATPISLDTITTLLGVPFIDQAAFRAWTDDIIVPPAAPERPGQVLTEVIAYLDHLIRRKRREPGDDLLSSLIAVVDDNDDRLSNDELRSTAFLLLLAGHETTLNLIANGVRALLEHPEQLAALRADWSLIDQAVDEVLRWEGSLTYATTRFTTEPYPVGDLTVPGGGTRVLIALGSANRDPGCFPEPDRFDIHRPPRAHLAFGHGIHHCLGAPLARLEGAIVIKSVLERLTDLELEDRKAKWRRSLTSRGTNSLRVRWTPTPGAQLAT